MSDPITVIVCGDDDRIQEHGDCPDPLHVHPLPAGYVHAAMEADRRLAKRWRNRRCSHCGLYGWEAPPETHKENTK